MRGFGGFSGETGRAGCCEDDAGFFALALGEVCGAASSCLRPACRSRTGGSSLSGESMTTVPPFLPHGGDEFLLRELWRLRTRPAPRKGAVARRSWRAW